MAVTEQMRITTQEKQEYYTQELRKTVCFLGLEGCGKSSIIRSLRGEKELIGPYRTIGLNVLTLDRLNINVIDCSGLKVFRKLFWTQALKVAHIVVFVIDASSPEKLEEVREALDFVYEEIGDQKPILFLSSKNDKANIMPPETIMKELNLNQFKRSCIVMPVSVFENMNLYLTELLLKNINP
ncbi:MAG: ADP-ribosylation factor-like protein [Candidatus Hermodarchaeota archaeon]